MDLLRCGHAALSSPVRLCEHLIGPEAQPAHVRRLTGRGVEADLICPACRERVESGTSLDLHVVCEGCADRVADDEWELRGWSGEPGILERLHNVDVVRTSVRIDVEPLSDRSLTTMGDTGWLCWTADGRLVHLDDSGGILGEFAVPLITEPDPEYKKTISPALHVAPDHRWAACVNDYGRYGHVIDLASGRVTLALDRGPHHPEQTRFPVEFLARATGPILVAGTDWNRLDAFDPETGQLLTPRRPTTYQLGEEQPDHYLDYFHGRLLASPSGRWLADDGWVWHPVGLPRVFDAQVWLHDNVWESDDGPSVFCPCQREYRWDSPMCWIDDNLLAVHGLGHDDEAMLDGVRVFDVATATEVATFAGPSGTLWPFESRLYSQEPDGVHEWNPRTGVRTARIDGLRAQAFNPATRTFAAIIDGELTLGTLRADSKHEGQRAEFS